MYTKLLDEFESIGSVNSAADMEVLAAELLLSITKSAGDDSLYALVNDRAARMSLLDSGPGYGDNSAYEADVANKVLLGATGLTAGAVGLSLLRKAKKEKKIMNEPLMRAAVNIKKLIKRAETLEEQFEQEKIAGSKAGAVLGALAGGGAVAGIAGAADKTGDEELARAAVVTTPLAAILGAATGSHLLKKAEAEDSALPVTVALTGLAAGSHVASKIKPKADLLVDVAKNLKKAAGVSDYHAEYNALVADLEVYAAAIETLEKMASKLDASERQELGVLDYPIHNMDVNINKSASYSELLVAYELYNGDCERLAAEYGDEIMKEAMSFKALGATGKTIGGNVKTVGSNLAKNVGTGLGNAAKTVGNVGSMATTGVGNAFKTVGNNLAEAKAISKSNQILRNTGDTAQASGKNFKTPFTLNKPEVKPMGSFTNLNAGTKSVSKAFGEADTAASKAYLNNGLPKTPDPKSVPTENKPQVMSRDGSSYDPETAGKLNASLKERHAARQAEIAKANPSNANTAKVDPKMKPINDVEGPNKPDIKTPDTKEEPKLRKRYKYKKSNINDVKDTAVAGAKGAANDMYGDAKNWAVAHPVGAVGIAAGAGYLASDNRR